MLVNAVTIESPVTTLLIGGGSRSPEDLKQLADLVGS